MVVKTNNHPRDILSWSELSDKERAEFDYFDPEDQGSFVKYKGVIYDLDDTEGIPPPPLDKWDMFVSETFFSGIVFKYPENDAYQVICGRYYT